MDTKEPVLSNTVDDIGNDSNKSPAREYANDEASSETGAAILPTQVDDRSDWERPNDESSISLCGGDDRMIGRESSVITILRGMVVDEETLEAEFQETIMANMTTPEAVCGEVSRAKALVRRLFFSVCLMVLAGTASALFIIFSQDDYGFHPTIPDHYEHLRSLIFNISGEKLRDENSPQYKALNWLAYEDGITMAALAIQETNLSTLVARYALAVLYYSTGGEHWIDDLHFLSNASVCEWTSAGLGVYSCDADGLPEAIYFAHNNLTGTLPDELFEITSLNSVSFLYNDQLGGRMPTNLGNLLDLKTLRLIYTAISGTIPDSSKDLVNLETLELFGNEFSGTLPSELLRGRMKFLKVGVFSRNKFTGTIPSFFQDSPVTFLDFEGNMLSGTLPPTLYSLRSLETLIFNGNMITGTISPSVGNLGSLVWLDGSSNNLEGRVPTQMGLLTGLETISLASNSLSSSIPMQLKELHSLKYLDLSSNELHGSIPSDLQELSNLVKLNLASNNLTGDVPSTIRHIPTLSKLSIQHTDIYGGLEDAFCNSHKNPPAKIEIEANCRGDTPDIECSCCTKCCDESDCSANLFVV